MAACKLTPTSMLSVVPIRETMATLIIYFITLPDSVRRYRLPQLLR